MTKTKVPVFKDWSDDTKKNKSGRAPSGKVKAQTEILAQFPPKFLPFFKEHKWIKIAHGGRSSGKSWSCARALLLLGQLYPLRILCAREFQSSLGESVYELLVQQIFALGLQNFYTIEKQSIYGPPVHYLDPTDGIEKEKQTVFIFSGIATNVTKIRSMEGINLVWCEESHAISKYSLDVLLPTIRSQQWIPNGWGHRHPEIWFTLNLESPDDELYKRWISDEAQAQTTEDDSVLIVKMNYEDNPWTPEIIKKQAAKLKERNPEEYNWVFGGEPRRHMEGVIYAAEMRNADKDGRVTNVPYDAGTGVQAFFDLGYADKTVVWFVQKVGLEIHFIDYYENQQETLDHYLKVISEKTFPVDKFWLPHDAKQKQLGTGMSIEEILRAKGKSVGIVPKLDIGDGINAVRSTFPAMWFDKTHCATGLTALRNYHYEKAEAGGWKDYPRHDKWSHAADALKYCCTCLKSLSPREKPNISKYFKVRDSHFSSGADTSWMTV